MRTFIIVVMLMSGMFTGQAIADKGAWWDRATKQKNCETNSGSRGKKDCNHMNFCKSSSAEACLAYVGDTSEDQGRLGLLNKCLFDRMRQCVGSARHSSKRSTNIANNPDPWDCITNPGKATQGKASPDKCRKVNFCLGRASTTCSDQIGAKKYTDEGRRLMFECVHPKEVECMRALK